MIGTIDEDVENAMARTADRKLEITKRAIERATKVHGLLVSDLFIDPLVLPVSTGMDSDRRSASELVEGTKRIRESFPDVQLTCGLSNVSFGLNPAARVVINAVLLHELTQAGMTSAILHASKITPLHAMDEGQKNAAMDLIWDRRDESVGGTGLPEGISDPKHDPLSYLIELFEGEQEQSSAKAIVNLSLEEKLQAHIVDGERDGLEETIAEALGKYKPLEIINDHLLEGMKTVGELFGSGQMQLPFVLQSAEVMKRAVALLEPHMEKDDVSSKGSIVLATVKGDVHDIGKNLVDILLSNNGFTVHNLGIKQPIDTILKAFHETKAQAIGLSGLLVKSVNVMEENLGHLNDAGVTVPVLLGGAALTRSYAEGHLTSVYQGDLHYSKDAFDGPGHDECDCERGRVVRCWKRRGNARAVERNRSRRTASVLRVRRRHKLLLGCWSVHRWCVTIRCRRLLSGGLVWLRRSVSRTSSRTSIRRRCLACSGSSNAGSRRKRRTKRCLMRWLVRSLKNSSGCVCAEPILQPKVVYGYWPCSSDGDSVVVFDPEDHDREVERFVFPRQPANKRLCIADFYRDLDECKATGSRDVIAMMCVTMGEEISRHTKRLFDDNQLPGLPVLARARGRGGGGACGALAQADSSGAWVWARRFERDVRAVPTEVPWVSVLVWVSRVSGYECA